METQALAPYLRETSVYIHHARAANTIKAYRSDWAAFERFCRDHGVASLPADAAAVASFAADGAHHLKANTIERRLTAIAQAHRIAGCPNPAGDILVRSVMAGIRRVKGTAQNGKEPLSPDQLRSMLAAAGGNFEASRDRALLLLGFAGAFRRAELVALQFEDLSFTSQGVAVNIRRSKTDPEGVGQTVGIPYGVHPSTCPVRALEDWLRRSGIRSGFLFRAIGRWGREVTSRPICDHQLANIIKRLAAQAGLDPAAFSGHSLRSGLATFAAQGGASERSIMDQTRHRSLKQVRKYIRRGNLFQDNAVAYTGL